jgi:myosin-5
MRMYDQWIPPGKDTTASDNTRFHATNVQKAKSIFCVRHFAGIVEYRAETSFMEKNKDEIPLTAVQMFETAPSQLIKDTYAVQTRENIGRLASDASGKQAKRKTVGQQFKEQLTSLIENVQKTDPHYIRCIKPNDAAKPMRLTRKRMTEQLRYGGVLEAVRVARASYPVRMSHEAFYKRYRVLLPATPESILPWAFDEDKTRQLCTKLVEVALSEGKKQSEATKAGSLHPHEDGITRSELIRYMHHIQPLPMLFPKTDVQIGLTKVFMRRHPHDCLEAHLVFHRRAIAIQSWARGLVIQRKYWIQRSAVEMIQRYYRGSQGRER